MTPLHLYSNLVLILYFSANILALYNIKCYRKLCFSIILRKRNVDKKKRTYRTLFDLEILVLYDNAINMCTLAISMSYV